MNGPAATASKLSDAQRRRLGELARAGKSLPWTREDEALSNLRLVRRYSGLFDEEFSDLTNDGTAVAHFILRTR